MLQLEQGRAFRGVKGGQTWPRRRTVATPAALPNGKSLSLEIQLDFRKINNRKGRMSTWYPCLNQALHQNSAQSLRKAVLRGIIILILFNELTDEFGLAKNRSNYCKFTGILRIIER